MATINTNTGQSFDDQQIKDWFGTGKTDAEVAQRAAELNLNQDQITNALSVGRAGTQDPNKVNSWVGDTSHGYAWDANGGLINAPSTTGTTGINTNTTGTNGIDGVNTSTNTTNTTGTTGTTNTTGTTGTTNTTNTTGTTGTTGIPSSPPANSSYTPSFASPVSTPSSNWNVQADQTVEGRINRLIDPNNPLIAQARANSAQQMNQRGLLNSSIASTAADAAAYQAAMPIAQADAATYAKAAEVNTNQENQFKTQNNQQGYDLAKMGVSNTYDLAKMEKTNAQQVAQLQQKFGYDTQLTKMQSDSAKETANITAQYRNLTQASASAASLVNNASDHIHSIMMNSDLDTPAKQVAIDTYNSNLNSSLQLIGSMAGDVDLSNMLASLLGGDEVA